jgi:D-alanyl-D-alanine dipeptidase
MNNLIEITAKDFNISLDLKYASTNNVCDVKMYNEARCFLHKDAAFSLKKAVEIAKKHELRFKIFDGFRPLEVQKFMYEKFSGDFVSNPKTGSIPHCRGVAVDLTLIDKNDNEIEMGSDFDEFSELAFHNCEKISDEAKKNRQLLFDIMKKAGFDFYSKEWWHYQLFDARNYEIAEIKGFSAV